MNLNGLVLNPLDVLDAGELPVEPLLLVAETLHFFRDELGRVRVTAAWGEPEAHTTLNTMHRELWDEYETKLIVQRERAHQESWAELVAEAREADHAEPKRGGFGCSVVLAVIVTGVVAVAALLGV